MGGLIILAAVIIPTLLWARLDNLYVSLILLATAWMGLVGFCDDYLKIIKGKKKDWWRATNWQDRSESGWSLVSS